MAIPSKLSLPNRIKLRFGSVFMRVMLRKFAKGAHLQTSNRCFARLWRKAPSAGC